MEERKTFEVGKTMEVEATLRLAEVGTERNFAALEVGVVRERETVLMSDSAQRGCLVGALAGAPRSQLLGRTWTGSDWFGGLA